MLLPPDKTIETEEQEDPRTGLVQRLLEYQAYKEVSAVLKEKEDVRMNTFSRLPSEKGGSAIEPELYLFDVNLSYLMGSLKNILGKAPPDTVRITRETLTVKERIAVISRKIKNERTIRFEDIFGEDRIRIQIIIIFLALLGILRLGLAKAYQDREFGTIWIYLSDYPEA